jgi:hypothetical protein
LFDGDDDKIEELFKQLHDIQAEVAPDKFKSEEELTKKFLWVTGQDKAAKGKPTPDDDELDAFAKASKESMTKPKPAAKERKEVPMPEMKISDDSDDDAFFADLIKD